MSQFDIFLHTYTVVVLHAHLSVSLPDFPQNTQIRCHFLEFLKHGYVSSYDSIQCKFPLADGSRGIGPRTVGINDGFAKILIMTGIPILMSQLEPWFFFKLNCA